ncbi:MAG: response regulator [Chloroflexi bacterium]|nr:response regulator [Chloroflexota bacterium]
MERPLRVLVIEDEEDVARLLRVHLERAGYDVAVALDGRAGLAAFLAAGADLVLLDVKLPELDGWEVCARLRAVSALPIVMVTACAHETDHRKALSLGADDFLRKPFHGRDLLARVAAALQRRSDATEQENRSRQQTPDAVRTGAAGTLPTEF